MASILSSSRTRGATGAERVVPESARLAHEGLSEDPSPLPNGDEPGRIGGVIANKVFPTANNVPVAGSITSSARVRALGERVSISR